MLDSAEQDVTEESLVGTESKSKIKDKNAVGVTILLMVKYSTAHLRVI